MPELNTPQAAPRREMVVRHRMGPLSYWVLSGAMITFVATVLAQVYEPMTGAPGMRWFDWLALAALLAVAAFFAWLPFRAPMTSLTLGADGSIRLATRTPFAAREMRLDPGAVRQVELRRNFFGPIRGWQVILRWPDGGRLVISERWNIAAQVALVEELERRLGLGPGA